MVFPNFRPWVESYIGLDVNDPSPGNPNPTKQNLKPVSRTDASVPSSDFSFAPCERSLASKDLLLALQPHCQKMSVADADRIFHSHGHTCQEIYTLRYGKFHRCVDAVVWPRTHADIVAIVRRFCPPARPMMCRRETLLRFSSQPYSSFFCRRRWVHRPLLTRGAGAIGSGPQRCPHPVRRRHQRVGCRCKPA
jgi:hypothetical protein